MNCFFATHHLSGFLEETLSDDKRREIADHLTTCPSCAGQLRELQATLKVLHRQPLLDPEAYVRARLRLRLTRQKLLTPWRKRFLFSPSTMLVMAVLTLGLMAVGFGFRQAAEMPAATPAPTPAVVATATPTPTPSPTPIRARRILSDQGTEPKPTPSVIKPPKTEEVIQEEQED